MTRRQTHGTLLQLSDGLSTPTFTTIAHCRSMTPPGLDTPVTELADHDMTDSKQYLPAGLGGIGPAEFEIYLDPQNTGHETLYALAKSRATRDWKIVLPSSGGEWAFSAFITRYQPGSIDANDGVLEATLALQAVSAPALT